MCQKTSVGSAPRALLRGHETGGHVGLALDLRGVEVVGARRADVDEDRVVLGGPAVARAPAVVVGPDDLVEKRVLAEELVEERADPVCLTEVEVDVERAMRGEHPARLPQARDEEAEVVRVRMVIGEATELLGAIRAPAEAHAGALGIRRRAQRPAHAGPAGVERRVEVDEVERACRQIRRHREVVAVDDEVVVEDEGVRGGEPAGHSRRTPGCGRVRTMTIILRLGKRALRPASPPPV